MQVLQLQRLINNVLNTSIKEDGIFGNITNEYYSVLVSKLSRYFVKNFDGFVLLRCSEYFDNKASDFAIYLQNNYIKEVMPCTTRAGDYYVFNPITWGGITGTAVLAEGFYPKMWQGVISSRFGFQSPELIQIRPVKIYRDGNKNRKIDIEKTQEGLFGINMHTQGAMFTIDNWSAGCITVPSWSWNVWCNSYFEIGKIYDVYLINIQDVSEK